MIQCLGSGFWLLASADLAPRKGKSRPEYEFFLAASDGCLKCVRRELEVTQRVSPDVCSDTNRYTVRDCVDDALSNGVARAAEVKAYLDEYWGHIPKRT